MLRLPKGYEFSGDSPSLYNFTLSPGWTREEIAILRLALMKFGIGRWKQITDSGCLEGKTPSQLNGQTQRLLGQQAIAEFSGLHIDPNPVREMNLKKEGPDVKRKNGCIINTGDKVTGAEVAKRLEANQEKYGLPEEIYNQIELPVTSTQPKPGNAQSSKKTTVDDLVKAKNIERRKKLETIAAYDTDCDEPFTSESDTDADADNEDTQLVANDIDTIDVTLDELRQRIAKTHTRRIRIRTKRLEKEKQEELREIEKQKQKELKEAAEKTKKRKATPSLMSNKASDNRKKSKVAKTSQEKDKETANTAKSAKPVKKATKAKAKAKANKTDTKAAERVTSKEADTYADEELEGYDEACICRGSNSTDPNWISCDKCGGWFHWKCMEITEEPDEDFEWLCPTC